ncbi:MAG: PadR family transcriptional regulator [Gammaproteobacteria bacterium]|nr:PadR family transcriptional regulator [Gammaproteobacteria bacterium]
MKNSDHQKWLSQFRKGFLELCVLSVLQQKKSSYGLELLQVFESSGLDINEGTLYPLLNRMQKNGWLASNWETPKDKGHPRRFYNLSAKGKELLALMLESNEKNQQVLNILRNLK